MAQDPQQRHDTHNNGMTPTTTAWHPQRHTHTIKAWHGTHHNGLARTIIIVGIMHTININGMTHTINLNGMTHTINLNGMMHTINLNGMTHTINLNPPQTHDMHHKAWHTPQRHDTHHYAMAPTTKAWHPPQTRHTLHHFNSPVLSWISRAPLKQWRRQKGKRKKKPEVAWQCSSRKLKCLIQHLHCSIQGWEGVRWGGELEQFSQVAPIHSLRI